MGLELFATAAVRCCAGQIAVAGRELAALPAVDLGTRRRPLERVSPAACAKATFYSSSN